MLILLLGVIAIPLSLMLLQVQCLLLVMLLLQGVVTVAVVNYVDVSGSYYSSCC